MSISGIIFGVTALGSVALVAITVSKVRSALPTVPLYIAIFFISCAGLSSILIPPGYIATINQVVFGVTAFAFLGLATRELLRRGR